MLITAGTTLIGEAGMIWEEPKNIHGKQHVPVTFRSPQILRGLV